VSAAGRLDNEAATHSIREIAAYLREGVGQRVAAAMAGLADAEQIGRYARDGGPELHGSMERRLREGYKVVRMLVGVGDSCGRHGRLELGLDAVEELVV
jgi:hypothetical protein